VDSSHTIRYEQPRRRSWRRSWSLGLACLCIVVGIVGSRRYVVDRWPYIQRRWWIYQCMHYQADARQPAVGRPKCWTHFVGQGSERDTVFCHSRRNKRGVERLIVVDMMPYIFDQYLPPNPPGPHYWEAFGEAWSFDPAELWPPSVWPAFGPYSTRPEAEIMYRSANSMRDLGFGDKAVLYNGQPDPTDESHFTVSFSTGLGTGIYDGWFEDDGSVKFELRGDPVGTQRQ
jgi:hypothetical protein